MARTRIRQHVNPLGIKYTKPISLPDWNRIYINANNPLHLDIGCARGKFLIKMALLYPDINFLGIEIREALVVEANENCNHLQLPNLYFLFCNINTHIEELLKSFHLGVLNCVSIQFPDPWFKRSHQKRRVTQADLVCTISSNLSSNGHIFLQSDIQSITNEMKEEFMKNSSVYEHGENADLTSNYFTVLTEREASTLNKNKLVYRALLQSAHDHN